MTLLSRAEIAELLLADMATRRGSGPSRSGRLAAGPPSGPVERAVVALQPGSIDSERQLRLVMAWLEAHRALLVGVVRWPADPAVDMVRCGEADFVIAAFAARSGGLAAVEADVVAAGGRVVYVREPQRRMRREVDDLAARMLARGMPAALVAEVLEVGEEQVRMLAIEHGRRPQRH